MPYNAMTTQALANRINKPLANSFEYVELFINSITGLAYVIGPYSVRY